MIFSRSLNASGDDDDDDGELGLAAAADSGDNLGDKLSSTASQAAAADDDNDTLSVSIHCSEGEGLLLLCALLDCVGCCFCWANSSFTSVMSLAFFAWVYRPVFIAATTNNY